MEGFRIVKMPFKNVPNVQTQKDSKFLQFLEMVNVWARSTHVAIIFYMDRLKNVTKKEQVDHHLDLWKCMKLFKVSDENDPYSE